MVSFGGNADITGVIVGNGDYTDNSGANQIPPGFDQRAECHCLAEIDLGCQPDRLLLGESHEVGREPRAPFHFRKLDGSDQSALKIRISLLEFDRHLFNITAYKAAGGIPKEYDQCENGGDNQQSDLHRNSDNQHPGQQRENDKHSGHNRPGGKQA